MPLQNLQPSKWDMIAYTSEDLFSNYFLLYIGYYMQAVLAT